MTKKFKYRPSYVLLLLGIGGIIASTKLFKVVGMDEVGFSFLVAVFGLGSLALGITFLIQFVSHFGSEDLKITEDHIEIPGSWKKKTILNFKDIRNIDSLDSWDRVIRISSKVGIYSIDGKLMKRNDFNEVKEILMSKI
ncbi:MAG: hypothetical protein KF687_04435 [Cyclobacteriaceae bacterium]|nr:hypothetical protein [Cyclobacteriaceae bacterium]